MSATSPPVVLVHGLATSARRTWVETGFVDLLTDEGRDPVLIDLPGHGGAPSPEPDEWADLDSWFDRRLDEIADGDPIDAVGFSLGARLLLASASASPRRFRRLVVAGVGANLFRRDDHDELANSLASGAAHVDDHPIIAHFHELARSSGTDVAVVAAMLAAPHRRLDDSLRDIEADVLVLLGDADFAGPADDLMERLPTTSRLVALRGVDHFATPKSIAFIDAALRFLAD